MLRRVDWLIGTDVSKDRAAVIFRVKLSKKRGVSDLMVKALQFCETVIICSRESLQSLAYFFAYLTKALFELSKSYSVERCVRWYNISESLCITFMEQYERFKYLANCQSTVTFM
jgi:hypothetical protein